MLDNCPRNDLLINVQSLSSWNDLGKQIGNLTTNVLRPFSLGRVYLNSTDLNRLPRVEFNCLEDEKDLERMIMVFAKSVGLLTNPIIKNLIQSKFPVRFDDKLRNLNKKNIINTITSKALAKLFDSSPILSKVILNKLTNSKVDLSLLIKDREALVEHLKSNVAGSFHPVGTCAMGDEKDKKSVVNQNGLVYGIQGLRVIDASIMPTIVSANTNLPTMMIAEKIADTMIKSN